MKKIKKTALFVLAAAVMLMICGCKSSDSSETKIGKTSETVGGADVLEGIETGKNEKNDVYEKESVKMVKIGGALYYETGEDSDAEVRCGTLDGTLKEGADEYEIPQGDGEANFPNPKGYQIGQAEGTVEIPIDDEWEIFKKIDTDTDVTKYKYCYELEGRLPNAAADSEYLVLANDIDITFEDASYRIFGSDTAKFKDIYVLPTAD